MDTRTADGCCQNKNMVVDGFRNEIEERHPIECAICSRSSPSIDDAIEANWIPSYFDHEDRERGPACPNCCTQYLKYDRETETYELIGRLN